MKKITFFLITLVFAVLGSACTTMTKQHYFLSEKDSGKTLHLNQGDTFTVKLRANPTTGYLWKFGSPLYDERIMILRGDKYIHPSEQLAGAPGKRSLTFVAEESGRTGLRLIYVRPWEKDTVPAQEFHILVIVKDGTEEDQKPVFRRGSFGEILPARKDNGLLE